jgi:pimeloyl-ACP methyl ester carboxylesterase
VKRFAPTNSGPIEYGALGGGSPVLILHGLPGGSDQGIALARILGLRGHRVISPSRPGYLGTSLNVGRTPEEQADACASLLDALGIRRAAVLANSAGGVFAAQLALRHPERVSRLVFMQAITSRMVIGVEDLFNSALLLPRATANVPSVIRLALRRGNPALIKHALALAWSTLPLPTKRDGVLNDVAVISELPAYPLSEIRSPSLLVHGDSDQNVPYAQSMAAAAAIPGARLLGIAGGNHSSILFDRRAIAAVLYFLRQR